MHVCIVCVCVLCVLCAVCYVSLCVSCTIFLVAYFCFFFLKKTSHQSIYFLFVSLFLFFNAKKKKIIFFCIEFLSCIYCANSQKFTLQIRTVLLFVAIVTELAFIQRFSVLFYFCSILSQVYFIFIYFGCFC